MNLLDVVFTAGLVNVLRTLFIIIVVFYAIRLIFRYLAPWLLKKSVDKMNQRYEDQRSGPTRREGDVTIEYPRDQEGRKSGDSGEYVDFEEVKD